MAYTSNRNENEIDSYYVKTPYTEGAEEFSLEYSRYTEYEGGYEFYTETTYFFHAPEGTMEFQSEDAAKEWLYENGYTNEY